MYINKLSNRYMNKTDLPHLMIAVECDETFNIITYINIYICPIWLLQNPLLNISFSLKIRVKTHETNTYQQAW